MGLGEQGNVVGRREVHHPEGEVEFRELEHALETQAFQDGLVADQAGLADALLEVHAGAAHRLQGGQVLFGFGTVHDGRRLGSDRTPLH